MAEDHDGFCTIDEALHELRAGRMIVLVDDEYRENEGDLVIPAEKVTPEAINFMVRNGCGILGLAMSARICERLRLQPTPGFNVDPNATPWTPPKMVTHGGPDQPPPAARAAHPARAGGQAADPARRL